MRLPVFDPPDVVPELPASDPRAADDRESEGAAAGVGVAVLPGQIALFGAATELLGNLHLAIEAGDFARARELRRSLIATEGASREARTLAFVEHLGDDGFWQREPAAVLAEWRRLDADLPARWPVRAWVRSAVVRRLVASLGAPGLVARVPESLPLVANWMLAEAGPGEGDSIPGQARELVRDALLSGRSLSPTEFDDRDLADLLAEDLEPEWLACLGVVRRLWACPPPDEADLDQLRRGPSQPTDSDSARRFWSCLKVVAGAGDATLRGEARRQMKRLHPEMHALCLRQISLAR